MAIDLLRDSAGCKIDNQKFTWRDLVQKPISKLDDDALTRARIILMHGLENEALRFGHMAARMNSALRLPLAQVRRSEQHQAAMINWLIGADHAPLETSIAHEQLAVEVTAAIAQTEPDAYRAQVYRFGLLDDVDHLYRYSALLDRLEGKDANNILQSYTDIVPGRPTALQHRAPLDDLRTPYQRHQCAFLSKLHALTSVAGAYQLHDYYMHIGPQFSDPLARQLYVEISAVEEQHVTQYESLFDPAETWLEQWLLHEANEVYAYHSCVEQETNHHVKAIWERFLDYELGHFATACALFKLHERRDPAEIIPDRLPAPLAFKSNRAFVRKVLHDELGLRADGERFVTADQEGAASLVYRQGMNREGSPSEMVAAGYVWRPGTELNDKSAFSGQSHTPH